MSQHLINIIVHNIHQFVAEMRGDAESRNAEEVAVGIDAFAAADSDTPFERPNALNRTNRQLTAEARNEVVSSVPYAANRFLADAKTLMKLQRTLGMTKGYDVTFSAGRVSNTASVDDAMAVIASLVSSPEAKQEPLEVMKALFDCSPDTLPGAQAAASPWLAATPPRDADAAVHRSYVRTDPATEHPELVSALLADIANAAGFPAQALSSTDASDDVFLMMRSQAAWISATNTTPTVRDQFLDKASTALNSAVLALTCEILNCLPNGERRVSFLLPLLKRLAADAAKCDSPQFTGDALMFCFVALLVTERCTQLTSEEACFLATNTELLQALTALVTKASWSENPPTHVVKSEAHIKLDQKPIEEPKTPAKKSNEENNANANNDDEDEKKKQEKKPEKPAVPLCRVPMRFHRSVDSFSVEGTGSVLRAFGVTNNTDGCSVIDNTKVENLIPNKESRTVFFTCRGSAKAVVTQKVTLSLSAPSATVGRCAASLILSLCQLLVSPSRAPLPSVAAESSEAASDPSKKDSSTTATTAEEATTETETTAPTVSAKFTPSPIFGKGTRADITTPTAASKFYAEEAEYKTQIERLYSVTRATEGTKPLVRGVVAVCALHCNIDATITALTHRWSLDWMPLLIGQVNEPARLRLKDLCSFLVRNAEPTGETGTKLPPTRILTHLMHLLTSNTAPEDIQLQLSRRARLAESVAALLRATSVFFQGPSAAPTALRRAVAGLTAAWFSNDDHFMARLAGGAAGPLADIRRLAFELLSKCSAGTSLSLLPLAVASHPFTADDMPALAESGFLREAMSAAFDRAPQPPSTEEDVAMAARALPNSFRTSHPGVSLANVTTGTHVDRTAMGAFGLRATNFWRIDPTSKKAKAPLPIVNYFEVSILSNHVKRMVIGLTDPKNRLHVVEVSHADRKRAPLWAVDSLGSQGENLLHIDDSVIRDLLFPYGQVGDVVGCGYNTRTNEVFFTLNGTVVARRPFELPAKADKDEVSLPTQLLPFVLYDTADRTQINVNFGSAAFAFDVASLIEVAPAPSEAVAERVALQAMAAWVSNAAGAAAGDSAICEHLEKAKQAVFKRLRNNTESLSIAGFSLLSRIVEKLLKCDDVFSVEDATEVCSCLIGGATRLASDHSNFSDAARLLGLLEKVLGVFGDAEVPDLVGPLYDLLKLTATHGALARDTVVPYCALWEESNDEASQRNAQALRITSKDGQTVGTGHPLPSTGKTSFTIVFHASTDRRKPPGLLGDCVLGVTSRTFAGVNSEPWKMSQPPCVWAVHESLSQQLPHANVSALGFDPMLFVAGSPVTIEVDRDRGAMSVRRGTTTYKEVFTDIPKDAELRPFVQIAFEGTTAVFLPGESTAAVTPALSLSGQASALLRHLISAPFAAASVGALLAADLKSDDFAVVGRALSVLGATLDCRLVQWKCRHSNAGGLVIASSVDGEYVRVTAPQSHITNRIVHMGDCTTNACYAVSIPDLMKGSEFYAPDATAVSMALNECAQTVVTWAGRTAAVARLFKAQDAARTHIEHEQQHAFDHMTTPHRERLFDQVAKRNLALATPMIQPASRPATFSFHREHSSPEVHLPRSYNGALMITPSSAASGEQGPFVGIAAEALPSEGIHNVRIKIDGEWSHLVPSFLLNLPPGAYVGVCLESYRGERRLHPKVSPPDMWAVSFTDTPQTHLPHSCAVVRGHRLIQTRDIVRLQVNRDKGTLEVFAKHPSRGSERSLGVLFDNLPADVPLYPFVQLPGFRNSALFLPENNVLPRMPHNNVRFAHMVGDDGHMCNGCLNELADNEVKAPNWYKCNQCSDYDLCQTCFNNHVHCGHDFTHMTSSSFVESALPRIPVLTRTAEVEGPSIPIMLVAASECRVHHRQTAVTGTSDSADVNGFAYWGALRKQKSSAALEINCVFTGKEKQRNVKVAFGLGLLDFVQANQANDSVLLTPTPETEKKFVVVQSEKETLPSDAVPRATRYPSVAIRPGDTVGLQFQNDIVSVSVNGATFATIRRKAWSDDSVRLAFFVFVEDGVTAQLSPPVGRLVATGKIADFLPDQQLGKMNNGGANRWYCRSLLREPLAAAANLIQLRKGMSVYVARATTNRLEPAVVWRIGDSNEPITVHDGVAPFPVALKCIYIPKNEAAENEKASMAEENDSCPFPDEKKRLKAFYDHHKQNKTDEEMNKAIMAYSKAKGGFAAMWKALIDKYGPEPKEKDPIPPCPPTKTLFQVTSSAEARVISQMIKLLSTAADKKATLSMLDSSVANRLSTALSLLCSEYPSSIVAATGGDGSSNGQMLQLEADAHGGTAAAADHDGLFSATSADDKAKPTSSKDPEDPAEFSGEWTKVELPASRHHTLANAVFSETGKGAPEWKGTIASKGFNAELSIQPEAGTAILTLFRGEATLQLKVVDRATTKSTRAVQFLLVLDDTAERSAKDNAAIDRMKRVTRAVGTKVRAAQCALTSADKKHEVFMEVSATLSADSGLLGRWGLPGGATGLLNLSVVGGADSVSSSATAAASHTGSEPLPDIGSWNRIFGAPTQKATPAHALQQFVVSSALMLHSKLLSSCDAPLPEPKHLLQELQGISDKSRILSVLRVYATRDAKLFGLLLRTAADVCAKAANETTPTKGNEGATVSASRVLATALDVHCAEADPMSHDRFFGMFRAAVCASHLYPTNREALKSVLAFVQRKPSEPLTAALMAPMFHYIATERRHGRVHPAMRVASEAVAQIYPADYLKKGHTFPVAKLAFLRDFARAVSQSIHVPMCADIASKQAAAANIVWLPINKKSDVKGNVLMKGRAIASYRVANVREPAKIYYEIVQPENTRVVLGWGTEKWAAGNKQLGFDDTTIGFDGASVFHDLSFTDYGWAQPAAGDVVGCLLTCGEKPQVAWSVNGQVFNTCPLPEALIASATGIAPVIQATSSDNGTKVCETQEQCRHLPPGFATLRKDDDWSAASYDPKKRSVVPIKPLEFYAATARWMDLDDEAKKTTARPFNLGSELDLAPFKKHIDLVERCLTAAWPLFDVDGEEAVEATRVLKVLKRVVRKEFRETTMSIIPPIETRLARQSLPPVAVRWYTLFSSQPRTPAEALHHSVLGQLRRQMDSRQFDHTPMFFTSLMMTDSGHVPIDAGGPYNQVWSLLSEEMMTDVDKANFHRNPLFRFVSNQKGKWLVPDHKRNSPVELDHFFFLGQILGHMARAKSPIALELSPFVWKFLVDDGVTVQDFYNDVEGFWVHHVEDEDLLAGEGPEVLEYFPKFPQQLSLVRLAPENQSLSDTEMRKKAAEKCVVHSMDEQLDALRSGLFDVLGRRCVRAMTAHDLELRVCGEAAPTLEQVKASITCNLQEPYAGYFWKAIEQMDAAEWSDFFYFCSAQKRYPLTRKITVTPSGQSTAHVPTASTCFSALQTPLYPSAEKFLEKLRQCIACRDMELA